MIAFASGDVTVLLVACPRTHITDDGFVVARGSCGADPMCNGSAPIDGGVYPPGTCAAPTL